MHNKSYVPVENETGLVRDLTSGAILNCNQTAYDAYLRKKKQLHEQKQQISTQQQDINNIKGELAEIKQLLMSILGKTNG